MILSMKLSWRSRLNLNSLFSTHFMVTIARRISSLRNALELMTIGTYCQVCGKTSQYAVWRSGGPEISFGEACDKLWKAPPLKPLTSQLNSKLDDGIFDQKQGTYQGGWVRHFYNELSDYLHSRPKFTNADLWESNGPIYVSQVFILFGELYFQTSSICYILVKIM